MEFIYILVHGVEESRSVVSKLLKQGYGFFDDFSMTNWYKSYATIKVELNNKIIEYHPGIIINEIIFLDQIFNIDEFYEYNLDKTSKNRNRKLLDILE